MVVDDGLSNGLYGKKTILRTRNIVSGTPSIHSISIPLAGLIVRHIQLTSLFKILAFRFQFDLLSSLFHEDKIQNYILSRNGIIQP